MIFEVYQTLAFAEIVHLKAKQGLKIESFPPKHFYHDHFAFETLRRQR
jgi:hypothetical protein